jgi:Glycosyl hydrolase family 30 TIM-barrel domain
VFSNEDAKNYIDGIGVHWYWDSVYPAQVLSRTHNKYPDKFILGTEACVGALTFISVNRVFYVFVLLFLQEISRGRQKRLCLALGREGRCTSKTLLR